MKGRGLPLGECRGAWALVTGASAGIGREFCRQLAAAGMHLVMAARRQDLLDGLAADLARQHGIRALVVRLDLSGPHAAEELMAAVEGAGVRVRLLCNNAACGHWGSFEERTPDFYEAMIRLNVTTPTSLCLRVLGHLASFPTSAIINVASPAALQPVPYMAVYAATKAFVSSFSQALYEEWKPRGVLVQTLVPGPTRTEFDTKAGAPRALLERAGDPAEVVGLSLAHLARGTPRAVAAKGTYRQRVFAGLLPAPVVTSIVGKRFRPPDERMAR